MAGRLISLAGTAAFTAGLTRASDPPPAENPLAGPTVQAVESSETRSLVKRGFNGTVDPLAIEAGTAAIELLDLTDEQQAQFDRLKAQRSDVFSFVFAGASAWWHPTRPTRQRGRSGAGVHHHRHSAGFVLALDFRLASRNEGPGESAMALVAPRL